MTRLIDKTVECAVCGKKQKNRAILSANSFGASDLDLRPPEMIRSTLSGQIRLCTQKDVSSHTIDELKQ